jgi:hypothetical protein
MPVLAALTGVQLMLLGSTLRPLVAPGADSALSWVDLEARNGAPALIVSSGDVLYPQSPLLDWHLVNESHLVPPVNGGKDFRNADQLVQRVDGLLGRVGLTLGDSFTGPLATRLPVPGQSRTVYLADDDNDPAMRPTTYPEFIALLRRLIAESQARSVIVLAPEGSTARYPTATYTDALRGLGMHTMRSTVFPSGPTRVTTFSRDDADLAPARP